LKSLNDNLVLVGLVLKTYERECRISDVGLKFFGSLSGMRYLKLNQCPLITDVGIRYLLSNDISNEISRIKTNKKISLIVVNW